ADDAEAADGDDPLALDGHVPLAAGLAGAVVDRGVADDEVALDGFLRGGHQGQEGDGGVQHGEDFSLSSLEGRLGTRPPSCMIPTGGACARTARAFGARAVRLFPEGPRPDTRYNRSRAPVTPRPYRTTAGLAPL